MTKILVAEDNPSNRELFRELLESWGYEVVEAVDGEAALKAASEVNPDAVLLDIQMPLLDGYEVLRRLRQDPKLAHLRVMALTAFAMRGDREKALASGFNAYHSKPINGQVLKRDIEQLLKHND
ncbi:MAG TPA: response regulator [Candidatus Polarisedimenticolia bacterium]|jgi:two-component system cell cycle response regulator DivK|nr:response regulator [Candidatus Polarisedimenticolia bacterium]